MKIPTNIFTSLLLIAIITFSCSSNGSKQENPSTESDKIHDPSAQSAVNDSYMTRGKAVYNKVCLACHQEDGSGVPMMFPPITESDIIMGEHDKLITIILDGMKGAIEIKGEEYNSIMPPQRNNLNDQQIADLLNYLRNSFGNKGDEITMAEVSLVRGR